jgi:hypothetical protein
MLTLVLHVAGYTLAADFAITILIGSCCTLAWLKDFLLSSWRANANLSRTFE